MKLAFKLHDYGKLPAVKIADFGVRRHLGFPAIVSAIRRIRKTPELVGLVVDRIPEIMDVGLPIHEIPSGEFEEWVAQKIRIYEALFEDRSVLPLFIGVEPEMDRDIDRVLRGGSLDEVSERGEGSARPD